MNFIRPLYILIIATLHPNFSALADGGNSAPSTGGSDQQVQDFRLNWNAGYGAIQFPRNPIFFGLGKFWEKGTSSEGYRINLGAESKGIIAGSVPNSSAENTNYYGVMFNPGVHLKLEKGQF